MRSPQSFTITGELAGSNLISQIDKLYRLLRGDIKEIDDRFFVWRDQLSDAISLQQSGSGISRNITEGTVDYAANATYNATFTLSDAMYANIQLNHDKQLTASIYPHLHWLQAKDYSPNFLLQYRWQLNGGAKTTSWTSIKCNTLAFDYVSGTLNQISYSAAIPPLAGSTLSDIIQFRIFRDTTGANAQYTGTTCPYNTGGDAIVPVIAFDIHFKVDSLGSTEEYAK